MLSALIQSTEPVSGNYIAPIIVVSEHLTLIHSPLQQPFEVRKYHFSYLTAGELRNGVSDLPNVSHKPVAEQGTESHLSCPRLVPNHSTITFLSKIVPVI